MVRWENNVIHCCRPCCDQVHTGSCSTRKHLWLSWLRNINVCMSEHYRVVLNIDCVSIMEVRFSPLSTVAIMFTDAWQRHQVLLDQSRLWPQWFRIKTNIIIQLLDASYQEMLESRWGWGLNLKAMESASPTWPQLLLFVVYCWVTTLVTF